MLHVKLATVHSVSGVQPYLYELAYVPMDALRVTLDSGREGREGVRFEYRFDARSLRGVLVVDEGDLIAVWQSPHYVPNAAVLYEVVEGSIFESCSTRPGLLSVSLPQERLDGLREYLVATDDDCILILSGQPPRVSERPNDA